MSRQLILDIALLDEFTELCEKREVQRATCTFVNDCPLFAGDRPKCNGKHDDRRSLVRLNLSCITCSMYVEQKDANRGERIKPGTPRNFLSREFATYVK